MYLESKLLSLIVAVAFPFFTVDESYVMKLEQFFSKHNITEVSTQEIVTVEAIVTGESNYEQKLRCMTEVIYYEAGGESFEGKKAVAQVVLNRKFDGRFPDNICDVVYEKSKRPGRTLCQFSWVCQNYKRVIEQSAWRESKYVAKIALTSEIIHVNLADNNALFFHSTSVRPNWNYDKVSQIGKHIFYASLK